MELRAISDVLARHRAAVLAGILPALAIAVAVAHRAAPAAGPSSSAQVLVHEQHVSPVDLDVKAGDSTPLRTVLIGDLLATQPWRTAIAARAGLTPAQLSVVSPSSTQQDAVVPIATEAISASVPRTPVVLTASTEGSSPILTLRATAPSEEAALATVRAAQAQLRQSAAASGSGVQLTMLGTPVTRPAARPSGGARAVAVALGAFALWCAAIVVLAGTRPRPRRRQGSAGFRVSSQ